LRFLNSPDMGPTAVFLHLLSFAAPALALALLVTLAARVLFRGQRPLLPLWAQLGLNAVAGLGALILGLWYFGVDGKMATYAGLIAAVAACQWVGSAAWRA
jgi:hypothetical protein